MRAFRCISRTAGKTAAPNCVPWLGLSVKKDQGLGMVKMFNSSHTTIL